MIETDRQGRSDLDAPFVVLGANIHNRSRADHVQVVAVSATDRVAAINEDGNCAWRDVECIGSFASCDCNRFESCDGINALQTGDRDRGGPNRERISGSCAANGQSIVPCRTTVDGEVADVAQREHCVLSRSCQHTGVRAGRLESDRVVTRGSSNDHVLVRDQRQCHVFDAGEADRSQSAFRDRLRPEVKGHGICHRRPVERQRVAGRGVARVDVDRQVGRRRDRDRVIALAGVHRQHVGLPIAGEVRQREVLCVRCQQCPGHRDGVVAGCAEVGQCVGGRRAAGQRHRAGHVRERHGDQIVVRDGRRVGRDVRDEECSAGDRHRTGAQQLRPLQRHGSAEHTQRDRARPGADRQRLRSRGRPVRRTERDVPHAAAGVDRHVIRQGHRRGERDTIVGRGDAAA